ncbi:MAG: hypothetical protein V4819_05515 [Verrucomicrobiota bacterium]
MDANTSVRELSPARPWATGRLAAVVAITLLGAGVALAANPLVSTTPVAPQTPQTHLDAVARGFGQFLHWQMMLRILLGFALAIGCAWFIAWQPRRATQPNASTDLEETKTLILLGLVGAAVAEISKLDQNMAFVIFGIGSLVRFRTVMDNPKVTGKAIMVVVIGLACGMNEWAMAAFVTVLTRGLVLWLDTHVSARFRIRVAGKHELRPIYAEVENFLRLHRCRVKSANLDEIKRSMVFIADVPSKLDISELEMSLKTKLGADCNTSVRTF